MECGGGQLDNWTMEMLWSQMVSIEERGRAIRFENSGMK